MIHFYPNQFNISKHCGSGPSKESRKVRTKTMSYIDTGHYLVTTVQCRKGYNRSICKLQGAVS